MTAPVEPLHPAAAAVSIFRVAEDGETGINHTIAVPIRDAWRTLDEFVSTGAAAGHLSPTRDGCYAVLDILDANDDIVQDFGLTTRLAYERALAALGIRPEPEQPPGKVCDHASVGVLITDVHGRMLMFERTSWPVGIAPPAGHVFDQHGSRDEFDQAYIDAARQEVSEEVGLTVTALRMVVDRWVDTRCGRSTPDGRVGHHWRVFQARVTGELAPSTTETRNARWYTPREVQELADRTVAWARRQITDEEFRERPGLEPVWVWWLGLLRILTNRDPDLLAVINLAEQPVPPGAPAPAAG